jgi:hypothetical protein
MASVIYILEKYISAADVSKGRKSAKRINLYLTDIFLLIWFENTFSKTCYLPVEFKSAVISLF